MASEETLPAENTRDARFAVSTSRAVPLRNGTESPPTQAKCEHLHVVQFNTNLDWGGGEQQVLDLVRGGSERGIRSTLLARPRSELYRRAGLEPNCTRVAFDFRSRYNPLTMIRLCQVLRKSGADVLHLHDSRAIALGVPAASVLGLRVILHRRISSPVRRNPWSLSVYRARCIAAYIAVSESARSTLLDLPVPTGSTRVIPSGVSDHELMPPAKRRELRRALGMEETTWIGTVGSLDLKKDTATFLRMAGMLKDIQPSWRYLIVGRGPERRRLRTITEELGLESFVRFTGHVTDAHRFTAALDAFVFPSLREGSPGAIKEAMSLGIPVIAADSPGTTEVVRPGTGWLVPPRDYRGFASAVLEVMGDSSSTADIAQRARTHVAKNFPIRATIEQTVALYRELGSARTNSARPSGLLFGDGA
jgi:glycosyltransferase involved in cell wall biosynthesis